MPTESALVAIIPEAEDLVSSFRDRFDPSAAAGVPAHVTVLYPFKPPAEVTAEVLESLRELFARTLSFNLSFSSIERFPAVLYLRPEPEEPLRNLTMMITECFPEAPPYGGAFTDVVPHLTIADIADAENLNVIAAEFARRAKGRLPIKSTVKEIVLMDNQSGRWRVRRRFALASA